MSTLGRRTLLLAVPLAACGRASSAPRCALCGMRADAAPAFHCEAETADGRLPFDAPRCMFAYGLDHPGRLRRMWVVEYYGGATVDASSVAYVVGSSRTGPMGRDLIPVTPSEAARFARDHGGRVVRFEDIDRDVLRALDP